MLFLPAAGDGGQDPPTPGRRRPGVGAVDPATLETLHDDLFAGDEGVSVVGRIRGQADLVVELGVQAPEAPDGGPVRGHVAEGRGGPDAVVRIPPIFRHNLRLAFAIVNQTLVRTNVSLAPRAGIASRGFAFDIAA